MSVAIALLGITALTRKRRLLYVALDVRGLRGRAGHRRLRRPQPAPRLPGPPASADGDAPDRSACRRWRAAVAAAAGAPAPAYVREIETWRRERLAAADRRRRLADGRGAVLAEAGRQPLRRRRRPTTSCCRRIRRRRRRAAFVLERGRVRVEVRPGVAVTLAGKPVTRVGAAVGRGRRDARRAVAGRADPADHRSRRPPGRARQGHEEPGARARSRACATSRSIRATASSRRSCRIAKPVSINVPERARDGREHAQPRLRVVHDRTAARRAAAPPRRGAGAGRDAAVLHLPRPTAGKTTYGAGRFLYADPPVDGKVVLDFNRAYSPPCAFTPHATCPLPPANNRLPVAIEAGEMFAGH